MNYDPRKAIRQAMMIARREVTAPNKASIKGQRHILAYITPYEAELLMRRGGSGRLTEYGVPAFDDGDGDGEGGGPGGDNDNSTNDTDNAADTPGAFDTPDTPDAPDQEEEQQQTAPPSLGPPGNLSALSTPDPGPPSGPHSGFGSAMSQDPEGTPAAANMNTAVNSQQQGYGVGIADTGGVAPTGFGAAPGIAEALDAYDKGIIGFGPALGYAALSAFSPPGLEFGTVTDEVGNQAVGGRGNIGGAIGGIAGMASGVPGAGTVGGMIGSQVADALGVPSHTFSFADGGAATGGRMDPRMLPGIHLKTEHRFAAGGATPDDDEAEHFDAYHGSPYKFDQFDDSKIGTGEGTQAYGLGHYVAQSEDVAKYYRDLGPSSGHMYRVRVNAAPRHFLDWDRPISEQHPELQEALRRIRAPRHLTGEQLYNQHLRGSDEEVTNELKYAGISGIKYWDKNSRDEGRGTRNYVVFDPDIIEIKRRYADGGEIAPPRDLGADPTVQQALSYTRKVNPMGLYSHAADVAANLPQQKGTPQQMLSMLTARGVKPDEINNSGAQDSFGNQKTVAKQDLVAHFQQNMPDIQEKKFIPRPSWGRLEASNHDPEIYAAAAFPAKFFEWTTAYMEDKNPEDIDYREILLHSQPHWNENAINDWLETQAYNKASDFGAISSTDDWNNLPENEKNKFTKDAEQRLNYLKTTLDFKNRSERSALLDPDKNFFSTHWAVPNVIGHIRMHDRDGEDTLHVEELQSDWGQAKRNGEDVPEHPLINNTNTWTDLLLKRVLREAARRGYKRIAWTPGQEQAERYDLSQQIHQLNYDPEDKVLSYYHKDRGWDDLPRRVNPDEIQKYVGKEIAKNLLSQPPSPLNGSHSLEINTQVGGEGMRAYYDKIVPARMAEITKKLGVPVKVEPYKINTRDGEKTLHSIVVTPELKSAVLKGMPVYKDGGMVGYADGSIQREGLRGGGSPDDDVVRQALQRVATPFSEDPEVVQQALRIASSLKVPQGAEFGTGSFYSVKQPTAVSDVSTQMQPIPGVDLAPKKELTWEDFYKQGKGGTILNVGGDRSNLGRLTHINNKELAWPVDLHAGPKYMMEPNPGAVWANNPSHATALRKKILEAAEKGPVYGVYAPMGAQAVDSSHNMFDAVMAQVPNASISKKDAKEFDDAIMNGLHVKGNDPKNVALRENAKKELEGWPGILNAKEASEYARNMPGGHRSAIVKFMDSKKWRDMNFPAIGITRVAITDPELKAAAGNMLGHRVVEFDPQKIAEETKFQHSTYTSPTSGRYVGDVPLVHKPTVSGQVVHPYSMDPLGRSTARKLFEEQKQLQPVNERMINTIGEGLERQKDYGLKKGGSVVDQALRMTDPNRPMVALADIFQRQLRGRPPS